MTEWKARPTTYNGIEMRSRLEARYAAALDAAGYPWEYEPRAFANQHGQYLPDFAILRKGGERGAYIEVKPTEQFAWLATKRMEIIWDSEPDALLIANFPSGEGWGDIHTTREHEWTRAVDCQNCASLALEREELTQRVSDLIAERDDLRARLSALESYRGNGRVERVADILKTIGAPT